MLTCPNSHQFPKPSIICPQEKYPSVKSLNRDLQHLLSKSQKCATSANSIQSCRAPAYMLYWLITRASWGSSPPTPVPITTWHEWSRGRNCVNRQAVAIQSHLPSHQAHSCWNALAWSLLSQRNSHVIDPTSHLISQMLHGSIAPGTFMRL